VLLKLLVAWLVPNDVVVCVASHPDRDAGQFGPDVVDIQAPTFCEFLEQGGAVASGRLGPDHAVVSADCGAAVVQVPIASARCPGRVQSRQITG
jgi:hypothetical protein